jgi:hypothetical protein
VTLQLFQLIAFQRVSSYCGLLFLVRPISTARIGSKAHLSCFDECLKETLTCEFNVSNNREIIVRETWKAKHHELKTFFKITHFSPTNVEGRESC